MAHLSNTTRPALERLKAALHKYGDAQDAYDHRALGVSLNLNQTADHEIADLFRSCPELNALLPEIAAEIQSYGKPLPGSPFDYLPLVESLLNSREHKE